jgi:hypothetical protein
VSGRINDWKNRNTLTTSAKICYNNHAVPVFKLSIMSSKHIRVEVWVYAFLTSATDRPNGCISPKEEALRTQ